MIYSSCIKDCALSLTPATFEDFKKVFITSVSFIDNELSIIERNISHQKSVKKVYKFTKAGSFHHIFYHCQVLVAMDCLLCKE